jgi:Glycosyltransferase family 87
MPEYLVDYPSARALRNGRDPYATSADLIDAVDGPAWPIEIANPHPPTLLPIVLPFSLLPYRASLAAWSMAMVFAYVLTLHLVGLRLSLAVPFGIAVALTFPGAYGIGNPVPLIGLGIACAYRFRDTPALAGAGLALATAPKSSTLVLLLPFVLTRRWRAALWGIVVTAVLAYIPLLFYASTWSRYRDAGWHAINVSVERADNASILNLADRIGILRGSAVVMLGLLALVVAIAIRDLY